MIPVFVCVCIYEVLYKETKEIVNQGKVPFLTGDFNAHIGADEGIENVKNFTQIGGFWTAKFCGRKALEL